MVTNGKGRELEPGLEVVLNSAARLQLLLPDAVLVGGSAAAYYARHRMSYDHDHVIQSLRDRFDVIFEALDREGNFVLARAIPDKIILGELGGGLKWAFVNSFASARLRCSVLSCRVAAS